MKNIMKSIKNIIKPKKNPTIKDLFENMDSLLQQAENDAGGKIFPKEKILTTEQVHYKTLRLPDGADFVKIKEHYAKLKKKYNPEKYKNDETKYQKAIEADLRLEVAFSYFKKKFDL